MRTVDFDEKELRRAFAKTQIAIIVNTPITHGRLHARGTRAYRPLRRFDVLAIPMDLRHILYDGTEHGIDVSA